MAVLGFVYYMGYKKGFKKATKLSEATFKKFREACYVSDPLPFPKNDVRIMQPEEKVESISF